LGILLKNLRKGGHTAVEGIHLDLLKSDRAKKDALGRGLPSAANKRTGVETCVIIREVVEDSIGKFSGEYNTTVNRHRCNTGGWGSRNLVYQNLKGDMLTAQFISPTPRDIWPKQWLGQAPIMAQQPARL
jgi:hypothetical protein